MRKKGLYTIAGQLEPADLRLYYPDGDQERFWRSVRESPQYSQEVLEVQAEGKRLRGTAIPELTYSLFSIYARTGSRLEYERVYFERRRRLNTWVLLSLLEPEQDEHLSSVADILWSILSEYTWCLPAHLGDAGNIAVTIDLFSAETGFTLSEVSCLLGDRLPSLLQSRIKEAVNERLFVPFLTRGPYHWETATHNWAAVCAGSIGAAALLLLKEPERLDAILVKVQSSIAYFLQGFGEDGACLEGLGYWNYGFGYFIYYADLLHKRSGGRLDWFRQEKVRSIAAFQQKCFLGGEFVANFSDAQPRSSVQLGLSHYLAAVFPEVEAPPLSLRASFSEDHCSRWAPALRNLIWKDPAKDRDGWADASYYLPDAQWLLSRRTSQAGAFGFAAKGGSNDEPHNHNDLGQFILLGEGAVYVSDLGSGEYTSGYFGAERYTYDCNGSQGHSVPIIDGQHQLSGPEAAAVVLQAAAGGAEDLLVVDLTRAYAHDQLHLHSLTRSFVWAASDQPSLTMSDEFHFGAAPAALIERIVTLCPPQLAEGKVFLQAAEQPGRGLSIAYDGEALHPVITEHTFRDHFGAEQRWFGIDFHVDQPGTQERYVFEFEFINHFIDKNGGG